MKIMRLKRILSLIMVFALVTGMLSVNALAASTGSKSQIQGYYNVGPDGQLGAESKYEEFAYSRDQMVTISKEIAPTGTENVFDVTLSVESKVKMETIMRDADAAVSMVLDFSGSMLSKNESSGLTWRRHLITETAKFMDGYGKSSDGGARWLTITLFDERALQFPFDIGGQQTIWVDLSDAGTRTAAIQYFEKKCYNFSFDNSMVGQTDISVGLDLGNQRLQDAAVAEVDSRAVVLFSDGIPNYYNGKFDAEQPLRPFNLAIAAADRIKATGADVHSIFLGDEAYTVREGNRSMTAKELMQAISSTIDGSPSYTNATTGGELTLAFEKLVDKVVISKPSGWIVNDPMGAIVKNWEYLGNDLAARGVRRSADNSLTWDLSKDTPTEETETSVKYSFTYQITLDATNEAFNKTTTYPTNGYTLLTYKTAGGVEDKLAFPVPGVTVVHPMVDYTIEFWKLPRVETGKALDPTDVTKNYVRDDEATVPGTAKLFTAIDLTEYKNQYGGDNYYGAKLMDTYTLKSTVAENNVIRLYYAPKTTSLTAEFYLKTVGTDANGNPIAGEYPDTANTKNTYGTNEALYVGKSFTVPADETFAWGGMTYKLDTATTGSLTVGNLKDSNDPVKLYYVATVDDRAPASLKVTRKLTMETWELNESTGRFESKTVDAGAPETVMNILDGKATTKYSLDTADYTTMSGETFAYQSHTATGGTVDSGADGKPMQITLAPGANTVDMIYYKATPKDNVRNPATVTVNYVYTKDVMYLDENGQPQHDTNAPTQASDIITDYYVGERYTADGTKYQTVTETDADGVERTRTYELVTPAADLTKTLSGNGDTITVEYKLVDPLVSYTVTVNHVYHDLKEVTITTDAVTEEVVDETTGETTTVEVKPASETTEIKHEPTTGLDNTQPHTVYAGQRFTAPLVGADGYILSEAETTDQYKDLTISGNLTITIYYDSVITADGRNKAEVEVTHKYYTTYHTVVGTKLETEVVPSAKGPITTKDLTAGDNFKPTAVSPENGITHTLDAASQALVDTGKTLLTGLNTMELVYNGEGPMPATTTLTVTHKYMSRTMGVDGTYSDDASTWTTVGTSNDVTINGGNALPNPLYVGMTFTVDQKNTFDVAEYPYKSGTTTVTLGENGATVEITYLRDIPLPTVEATVQNFYNDITISATGERTEVPSQGEPTTSTPYQGAPLEVTGLRGGYTDLTVKVFIGGELVDPSLYTVDGDKVTVTATNNVKVEFYYSRITNESLGNEATYTIRHFYRNTTYHNPDPAYGEPEVTTGSSYGTLQVLAAPNPAVYTEDVDKRAVTGGTWDPDTNLLTLVAGENTVDFYYSTYSDTRRDASITLEYVYNVVDPVTGDVISKEYGTSKIIDQKDAGAFVGNNFSVLETVDGVTTVKSAYDASVPDIEGVDRTYTYTGAMPETGAIVVSEKAGENTITLTYTRPQDSTTYHVEHQYYLDGSLVWTVPGSGLSGTVGQTVTGADVEKVPTYNTLTFAFTGTTPAEGITLVTDAAANVLVLRYDATTGGGGYEPEDPEPEVPLPTPDKPGPDPETPPSTGPEPADPVTPPETEIPDDNVPLDPGIDIIEPDVPLAGLPEDPASGDGTLIVDEGVPLGDLPQTGTTREKRAQTSAQAALGLAAAIAAAGAAFSLNRKKNQD